MGHRNAGLMLVVMIGLSGAAPVAADETEDRAAAAVEKRGGWVERDRERPGHPIVQVGFPDGTRVTDAGLKELAPLKALAALHLPAGG